MDASESSTRIFSISFFQIDRYGIVLNGIRSYYITRGQPPVARHECRDYLAATPMTIWRSGHIPASKCVSNCWNGPAHRLPPGSSTCGDAGTDTLSPAPRRRVRRRVRTSRPIFDRDVRRCVPIHVDVALVRSPECWPRWLTASVGVRRPRDGARKHSSARIG